MARTLKKVICKVFDSEKSLKTILKICKLTLFPYLFIILYLTLIHRTPDHPQTIAPLFYELRLIIRTQDTWSIIDSVRNLLMLMPFGFMISEIFPKFRNIIKIALIAFAFSVFIEITQFITARGTCQMDDIMNNTLGAVVGGYIQMKIQKHKKSA